MFFLLFILNKEYKGKLNSIILSAAPNNSVFLSLTRYYGPNINSLFSKDTKRYVYVCGTFFQPQQTNKEAGFSRTDRRLWTGIIQTSCAFDYLQTALGNIFFICSKKTGTVQDAMRSKK